MSKQSIIIAVDGYSSTGKSTFARLIAREYSLLYLDSGALYRAVTLFAMENGFITRDGFDSAGLRPFLGDLNVHFRRVGQSCRTFIGGRDVEDDIRTMAVSDNVSMISADSFVRRYVDSILRHCAAESGNGAIMDGRDIGTTVFPNADLKIFMIADTMVRAGRRAAELEAKGQAVSLDDVVRNLEERDWADSHREISPLVQAPDALVLDNTDMTVEEQLEWIKGILYEKFGLEPLVSE